MSGRRSLLLGAGSVVFLAACGKSRKPPPPITFTWIDDLSRATDEAVRRRRPIFAMFGATWDCGTKELEHQTFPDPDIAALLATGFVPLRVDCGDDEDRYVQHVTKRFAILGVPTMIVMHPASRELWRANQFLNPAELLPALTDALVRYDAIV